VAGCSNVSLLYVSVQPKLWKGRVRSAEVSQWEYLQLLVSDDRLSLSPPQNGYEALLDEYNGQPGSVTENPSIDYDTRRAEWRRIVRRHHEIFTEMLNSLGRNGWELVVMHAPPAGPGVGRSRDFYFKREIT
jgi:hypothetical protein